MLCSRVSHIYTIEFGMPLLARSSAASEKLTNPWIGKNNNNICLVRVQLQIQQNFHVCEDFLSYGIPVEHIIHTNTVGVNSILFLVGCLLVCCFVCRLTFVQKRWGTMFQVMLCLLDISEPL